VTKATAPVTYLKSSKIIANHYNNKSDFSTLYIKADAKYSDDDRHRMLLLKLE
jgi:hypothetical protein